MLCCTPYYMLIQLLAVTVNKRCYYYVAANVASQNYWATYSLT